MLGCCTDQSAESRKFQTLLERLRRPSGLLSASSYHQQIFSKSATLVPILGARQDPPRNCRRPDPVVTWPTTSSLFEPVTPTFQATRKTARRKLCFAARRHSIEAGRRPPTRHRPNSWRPPQGAKQQSLRPAECARRCNSEPPWLNFRSAPTHWSALSKTAPIGAAFRPPSGAPRLRRRSACPARTRDRRFRDR